MKTILVVEDGEFDFLRLKKAFDSEYKVEWRQSISDCEAFFEKHRCDLVILDLNLGQDNGLQLCTFLRSHNETKHIPIIILSSHEEVQTKIMGLKLGADDYVTKPFNVLELKARVNRRMESVQASKESGEIVREGPFTLDIPKAEATCFLDGENRSLSLTPTEFRLLLTLVSHPSRIYSRPQLVEAAYGATHNVSNRTLDSHIRSLRQKMGEFSKTVETIYGEGYRFQQKY